VVGLHITGRKAPAEDVGADVVALLTDLALQDLARRTYSTLSLIPTEMLLHGEVLEKLLK